MKKFLTLTLLCLLLTSCALTDLGTTATPTRAPTRVNTPRPPLVVPTTEVVVPTFPPRTGTPSAVTTPTPNRDSPMALAQQFDGKAALAHTRYLTLHELAGRKAGAPGADKAADYIAEKFKAAGLKPVGDNGTYFQNFTLPFIDLAEAPTLRLLSADGLVKRQFKHRVEFSEVIGGRAGDGQAEGRLVFVGRGTKADLDLAGDLQNTVALMAPAPTTPRDLITQLSARGVLGIIQVTGNAANLQVRFSYIPDSLIRDGQRAVVRVSREVADELLFGSGATLQELEDKLNRDGMAFLATPNRVSMSVKLVPIRDAPTKNVVGALIGSDPTLANEVYIVGGHYDHVGVDPDGAVFEGANDNASGTAVTVALAEFFAQHAIKPKRTIVFAAWTGEEAGLVGSQYYVDHPIFPLAQTKGYINLDVVGAGSGEGLTITNDAPTIGGAARRSATDLGVVFGGGAIGGGSDHESFAKAGVAATFFIWQRYGDIHVPGDTFDKIEVEKLRATGQVAALTLMRLAEIGK